jgi:hypothetical protein
MKREDWVNKNAFSAQFFGPSGDEEIGGWRNMHNEQLQNSCSSSNIFRAIKSRGRWM